MKTTRTPLILAALMSMGAFLGQATAQTTSAATVPVGFITYNLVSGQTISMGVPLADTETYTGPSSAVTSTTLSASGVTWTAGAFATASAPYFVNILSGSQAGRTLKITANTSSSVTLEVGDTNLDASGFAVAAGDRFEIVQGDTLATLFGTGANVVLQGDTSIINADTVSIWNDVKWQAYFYRSDLGYWVKAGGGTTNQNDTVLYPDKGLLINRKGADKSFVLMGRVPSTQQQTKLPGALTSAAAVRFPTDTTLGGLNFTGPGTWIADDLSINADTVSLWNGVKWVPYWKDSIGRWRKAGGGTTDFATTTIPAGTALLINKKGSGSGSGSFFTQALPYSLN